VIRNVLFFQESISPDDGGVPRVTNVLSRQLESRGYRCFFVFSSADNSDYDAPAKLSIDVHDPATAQRIIEFIRSQDIDILICQNAYHNVFIAAFKQIRVSFPQLPFVCFLHASPTYWKAVHRPVREMFQYKFWIHTVKNIGKTLLFPIRNPYVSSYRSLYNISDKFVLLSESFKKPFRDICGIVSDRDKLLVIPNPLSFDVFVTPGDIKAKEKIVLIVSRLDEDQKRLSQALRAWWEVGRRKVNDWKLIIVGSGPDEGYYREYVRRKRMSNVIFAGQQRSVSGFYERSSIFLMTSVWEGLPMSLLEAQQHGVVPVVYDSFSAIHDVVTDGQTGRLIKNGDIGAFALAVERLMEDDEGRARMATQAVEASRRFRLSGIVDEWEKLIMAV